MVSMLDLQGSTTNQPGREPDVEIVVLDSDVEDHDIAVKPGPSGAPFPKEDKGEPPPPPHPPPLSAQGISPPLSPLPPEDGTPAPSMSPPHIGTPAAASTPVISPLHNSNVPQAIPFISCQGCVDLKMRMEKLEATVEGLQGTLTQLLGNKTEKSTSINSSNSMPGMSFRKGEPSSKSSQLKGTPFGE
ncbi:proline-rich protein 12-like isoform X2 [Trachinotus anak]